MKMIFLICLCRAGLGASGKHTTFYLGTSNVFPQNIRCFPLKHCLIFSLCKSGTKNPLAALSLREARQGDIYTNFDSFTSTQPELP